MFAAFPAHHSLIRFMVKTVDAGIVLSCVLVGSEEDAFQLGLCEVLFKTVRVLKSRTRGKAMSPD